MARRCPILEENQVNIECAHCGNKQLNQIPGVWTLMPMTQEGLQTEPLVPVVVLGCPTCGFLQSFTAQAIRPIPWPEAEAGEQPNG